MWRSDLIMGGRERASILVLSRKVRLEGLGRMGSRIHQSPGPLVQSSLCLGFPIRQNGNKTFLAVWGSVKGLLLTNWFDGEKCGKGKKGRWEGLCRPMETSSCICFLSVWEVGWGWVQESIGIYFSLGTLWNTPGATPHYPNHIWRYLCLGVM